MTQGALLWAKVWCESLTDPHWSQLSMADRGRWVTLLLIIKQHGTKGTLSAPVQFWMRKLECATRQEVINVADALPNVCAKVPENDNTEIALSFLHWRRYQIDPTCYERVKRHRQKKKDNAIRREEKRREKDESDGIPYKAIIWWLNKQTGKAFTPTAATHRKHIRARWNEGHWLDAFKHVIDVKSAQWNGTDRAKFLRPETLFGNKFEGYLNEREPEDASDRWQV